MKIKTSELIGPALDWAVAKCEGYSCQFDDEVSGPWLAPQEGYLHDEKPLSRFKPSTDWAQGGTIIEREKIGLDYSGVWSACHPRIRPKGKWWRSGPTPLIAAMRAFVASKLGDEVDIPEELK